MGKGLKRFVALCFFVFTATLVQGQFTDTSKYKLKQVEVAGKKVNPAHRIIKAAVKNREQNGAFSNKNFSLDMYQRLVFTGQNLDTAILNSVLNTSDTMLSEAEQTEDSLVLNVYQLLQKNHLFMMETLNKYIYKKPDNENVQLLAQKTAGFKDPILAILLSQQFPNSFYKGDVMQILQQNYINPISNGAVNKYFFTLKDTLYQGNDSIFVIDFEPKPNAKFTAMTGTVHITSDQYAFTKITMTPSDKKLDMQFSLTHHYQKHESGKWFPEELDFFVDLFRYAKADMVLMSKTTVSNIEVEQKLRGAHLNYGMTDDYLPTVQKQEELLSQYRYTPLDSLELETYNMWDTIAEELPVNRLMFAMKTISTGSIAAGPIDFNVFDMFGINKIEKFRLGLAVSTNNRMSKWVSLGGYFGYGFHDKKWKWGGNFDVNIIPKRRWKASFAYSSDLVEAGGVDYLERDYTLLRGEFYRSWIIDNYDRREALQFSTEGMILPWLMGQIQVNYNRNKSCYQYSYQTPLNAEDPFFQYDDFNVKASVRIAFKERVFGSENFYYYTISKYPVVKLQYTRGFADVVKSDYNYNKIDLFLFHHQDYRILGYSEVFVYASFVDRSLPYSLLVSPRAGYGMVGFEGKEQLGAMRANEFLSDKSLVVMLRHNFGRMTSHKRFSPRIEIIQGFAIGGLRNPELHHGVDFKTMEKGYFETGLMVKDLLVVSKFLSFGVGVYCRYGAYWLPNPIDNFAFKLSFRVPFMR